MGNCQAVDAAALVVQHPCGKVDRMYCSLTASDVMKANPGHYVSLIIPLPVLSAAADEKKSDDDAGKNSPLRFTRVKLLRPTDTLVLGRAYRLVTTQEVMKVLRAKKHAKMKQKNLVSEYDSESEKHAKNEAEDQAERNRRRSSGSTNIAAGKAKSWRPSLQSISEAGS